VRTEVGRNTDYPGSKDRSGKDRAWESERASDSIFSIHNPVATSTHKMEKLDVKVWKKIRGQSHIWLRLKYQKYD
jgi:hypothetical protein